MSELAIFNKKIRRIKHEGETWFAVVDVVEVLAETTDHNRYWRQLKQANIELVEIIDRFPLKHKSNGRTYQTDCANQEGILRIIQSIPSPKAEPFKRWLAMTGDRRLNEIANDPIEALREQYRIEGYDDQWITVRIESITTRNELTDEWAKRGIELGWQYGALTNEIHKGAFEGMTVRQHHQLKGLGKGDQLRDHMTSYELAFSILGEARARDESIKKKPEGFAENEEIARQAGEAAGAARKAFEEQIGEPVISNKSYLEERKRLTIETDTGEESAPNT